MIDFAPSQIIEYHRKSRQDDPTETVEKVLEKHKRIADEWVEKNLSGPIPQNNLYMERVSGETIKDRVEFQKVLRRVEDDSIKAVFVIEPQRLSRGDLEDCGHIINVFRYTKTLIITPHRIYNLADDGDRMILEMELKQGNAYLEYTKRILKRGREDSLKRGNWIYSSSPLGYRIERNGKSRYLVPDEKSPFVKKMFEMYASGCTLTSISNFLYDNGIKTKKGYHYQETNLLVMLQNKSYIGYIPVNRTSTEKQVIDGQVVTKRVFNKDHQVIEGFHEPIIEKDLFDTVQSRIGTIPRIKEGLKQINAFQGLLVCGCCGYRMLRKDKRYIRCTKRKDCENGLPSYSAVLEDVINALRLSIEDFSIKIESSDNAEELKQWESELKRSEDHIIELSEKEIKIWDDRYSNTSVSMPDAVFNRLLADLAADRDRTQERIDYLKSHEPERIDYAEKILTFQNAIDALMDDDVEAKVKNEYMKKCIKKIVLTRKRSGRNPDTGKWENPPHTIDIFFI